MSSLMLLRAIGTTTALLGAVLLVLGVLGAHQASERAMHHFVASLQLGQGFDPCDWQKHWYLASVTIAAIGSALALGGTLVALHRRWGLLIVGSAILLTATYPWALKVAGFNRYPYENPDWVETLVLIGLACAAFYGFIAARRTTANGKT